MEQENSLRKVCFIDIRQCTDCPYLKDWDELNCQPTNYPMCTYHGCNKRIYSYPNIPRFCELVDFNDLAEKDSLAKNWSKFNEPVRPWMYR